MKPKRNIVLVTGSNGRIGDAVMQRLTGSFSDVVGFDRKAPAPPPPGCTHIPVDITSDDSVREGLRVLRGHHGTHIAAVVHLAAYYDFLGKPSPKYDEITVEGTRRLLRGLREGTGRMLRGLREGFAVEQFIFASTMLVHRPGEPGIFLTEDSPLGPTWAYPESKVRTEEVIRAERGEIPVVMLRFAGVYDDVCHSPPLANQIQRINEQQLAGHLYSGETSHGQAFIHLDDVVDSIERAIEHRAKLPPETAILIGEPETLSYDELQHTFSRLIRDESWETHNVPGPIAKAGAWIQDHIPGQDPFIKPWMIDRANDHYALDITRARTLLDWEPRHSLRETLPKMVAALQADPFGWYREHGLEAPASLKEKAGHAVTGAPEQPEHAHAGDTHSATLSAEAPPAHDSKMHVCPMHPEVCQSSPGNCPRCDTALEPVAPPTSQAVEYTCPMHPEVVASEPGKCPKCGMTLEPRTTPAKAHAGHGDKMHAGHAVEYTCPMHSEIVRSEPGNCPKCGMVLVPRGESKSRGGGEQLDMMVESHRNMLWPYYLSMMLGFWLLTSPFTLGYMSDFAPDANQLRVMAERGLPSFELRNLLMTWSDVVSGILVIVFSVLSADTWRRNPWAQWANAFVGLWLMFAPLVFWTPLPEAYANGTLVGGLVIALAVLIPMMPGMSMAGMMGKPDVPPGWAYTPASWLQRMPIAVLALIGFLIARILGAYQLGHIDTVWEPFFAGSGDMKGVMNGTETIITSNMSKAWPIADGALGGIVYMLELVMVWMGTKTRWRTMPWMVLALAILILPLGVVSIYFVIIQPIAIGTWCTLCLIAALAMAVMIPYALNEFVAMGQFLAWSRKQGKPFWRTFWEGDAMDGGSDDTDKGLAASPREQWAQATRGVTYPWTLLLSIAIGVWLTFTRLAFDSSGAMTNSDHMVGLLVVTFSIIALAEVGRAIRFINIPFGAWLIAAPWLLDGIVSPLAIWNGVICGVLLIVLAIPRGKIKESYAGWDRYIV
ncbi:MAG: heavy metal-binding domain-containing protein [Betaproteobacteria bacterium]|nr:heavy metal-binding domain-containing protein [Betaproteobacteria bacterium]